MRFTDQKEREAVEKAKIERETILKSLSKLNFLDKQRDIFAKHHKDTGQWLLKTEKFQQWFNSRQSSTLWCTGDRMSISQQVSTPGILVHLLILMNKLVLGKPL
jgi:hypothetical protein